MGDGGGPRGRAPPERRPRRPAARLRRRRRGGRGRRPGPAGAAGGPRPGLAGRPPRRHRQLRRGPGALRGDGGAAARGGLGRRLDAGPAHRDLRHRGGGRRRLPGWSAPPRGRRLPAAGGPAGGGAHALPAAGPAGRRGAPRPDGRGRAAGVRLRRPRVPGRRRRGAALRALLAHPGLGPRPRRALRAGGGRGGAAAGRRPVPRRRPPAGNSWSPRTTRSGGRSAPPCSPTCRRRPGPDTSRRPADAPPAPPAGGCNRTHRRLGM